MKKLLLLIICLPCLLFTSANAQQKRTTGQLVVDKYYKKFPPTKYNLDSLKVVNDTLCLFIHYLGGCKTPVFNLVTNGGVIKTPDMPMMLTYLEQVDIKENCKKIAGTELRISLKGLKNPAFALLRLNIDNQMYIVY